MSKQKEMKLITAIIRETKLDEVREALINAEITRITVSRVSGHGQQIREEIYRGQTVKPDLIPKIRLEIAVNDEFVDITTDAIISSARTNAKGEIGDGKIFITQLEECIRIRTGEKGGKAI
jgi:nitrogen regulatory protein P-II 1